MVEAHGQRVSESEYLALERTSVEKHEYVNGEMFAMAGGTPLHAAIAANLAGALRNALRGKPCGVASSDLRVHVRSTGLYTYPDLTVVCGRVELHPEDDTVITNPTLIVEVLSKTTEAYDRGAKFAHYEHIPSLAEYLLVSADARRLEHYRRLDTGQWLRTVVDANDTPEGTLELPTLAARIAIADILEGLAIFA
ncbi:Uma2 family endonuclease [Sandaracinus amylolyticus]|uniref:Uma2 family endonuclease n=1 Tax=Sandaracinus amylolyticus TaxID=927083 RepID=UPI001F1A5A96|nr:Uma2 family endonuclease [Sandaracinus amylolyticus]UJR79420.1 Endonuclease, Uma2 family (Restriction endonuclease fold) [Sandaracinus amylolyticus]